MTACDRPGADATQNSIADATRGSIADATGRESPAQSERCLGPVEEIPDGGSRGYAPPPGGFTGLFAVRRGEAVFVYVNSCPPVGLPLEIQPHRFLDRAGELIVCAAHGARFRPEDGHCVSGPCTGDALEAVPTRIEAGMIWVPEKAGR